MNDVLEFDEAASQQLERMYSTPDIVTQRAATVRALHPVKGEKILDIGTGSGFLANDIAHLVGEGGEVIGIDVSESMVSMARMKCVDTPWIKFDVGDAVDLRFEDEKFDSVVGVQVFMYIADIEDALLEVMRVLRPGGKFVLVDTDWHSMSWNCKDADLMQKIMGVSFKHAADAFLPVTLTPKLLKAGFEIEDRFAIPVFNPDYDENTYSYGLIDMVASSLPIGEDVTQDEVDAWVADIHETGKTGNYFFSVNRYAFVTRKPA